MDMRKIKVVGLCLVAVFALSALIASSASAATYNTCQQVKKNKGKYADSACTVEAVVKGKPKGEYEIKPVEACYEKKKTGQYADSACTTLKTKKGVPDGKGNFEKAAIPIEANSGVATLETPAFGSNNVSCTSSHVTGTITGPKTATEQVVFSGCLLAGAVECTSNGSAAAGGTESGASNKIETNPLHINLLGPGETTQGFEGKTVPAGKVWTETTAANGVSGYQAVFSCPLAGAYLRTFGSLSGDTTPVFSGTPSGANLSNLSQVKFTRAEQETGLGEAGLLTEAAGSYGFSPVNGPAQSFQNETVTVNASVPIEIHL